MGTLPNTGSTMAFGKVKSAYDNGAYPRSAGANISLTSSLGSHISFTAGTTLAFSSTFGGRNTPYAYPP